MTQACPFCRKSDLADDAVKCPYCGSWLDPAKRVDEFEAFRRDLHGEMERDLEKHRTAMAADLDKHRGHIEKLLTRMQVFAGLIAAVAGGFAVYFTGVTRENITETTTRIEENARAQVQNAAEQATLRALQQADETVRNRVAVAIRERLDAPETEALIERTIGDSVGGTVRAEVDSRLAEIRSDIGDSVAEARAEVETRIDTARTELDGVITQITAIEAEATAALEEARGALAATETAVAGVREIKTSFANAQGLDVSSSDSVLDFQVVEGHGKEGLDQLPALVDARVNALTFVLGGGGYWSPIVWKYLDRLNRVPQFEHVILLDSDGRRALGYWSSRDLAQALNPPDNAEMSAALGEDPWAIPDEQDIPDWTRFTDWLNNGSYDALTQIAGYRPVEDAVSSDWSNFQALDHLLRLGVDQLPVVDGSGALLGFADRSRLTTRMLLEVAASPD